jgi:hypothetical protein
MLSTLNDTFCPHFLNFPILTAMAGDGLGRVLVLCWCPNTWSDVGSKVAPNPVMGKAPKSLQKSILDVLGPLAAFGRHGASEEGEGEPVLFPCPGVIELAWGHFFSPEQHHQSKVIHS